MIQPTNAQPLYPQQGGANAVSINIYNPQAYAGQMPQTAAQQVPYAYTNSLYQMPQASMYNNQVNPGYYQQYIPAQNPVSYPVSMPQMQPQAYLPAPQIMPQSVIPQVTQDVQFNPPQVQTQPIVQEYTQPIAQEEMNFNQTAPVQVTPAQAIPPQVAPVEIIDTPQVVQDTVNVNGLVSNLQSADLDVKADAINQIAWCAQSEPEIALQVVAEPVMNALVNIINQDTSNLQGPTEEQIRIAQKIANNEQLTPEEDALAEQLSPKDKANKNRIFALYTLAMIQKIQRDELNQYIETQIANGEAPIPPLQLNDLIGFDSIANIIQNDARPEVKVAAIQALQHVATNEDKATVQALLATSLTSNNAEIKAAAEELMAKFTV